MNMKNKTLSQIVIEKTFRVPTYSSPAYSTDNQGAPASRQLDVALMGLGFKASKELLWYVSGLNGISARQYVIEIIEAVSKIKGDHVKHNTYFKNFPEGVPDTLEFWTQLVEKTFGIDGDIFWDGNLLKLDGYGEYSHSYEEMLMAHEPLIAKNLQKTVILNLGRSIEDEILSIYNSLASSKVPANGDDLELLKQLAEVCIDYTQPTDIPVRENRAVINQVRVSFGKPILADTVVDVLRLAVALSGGDVGLKSKTMFKSMPNKTRRILLRALERIVKENPAKLGDVYKHRESFKRLFHRLYITDESNTRYDHAYKVLEYAVQGINVSFESKMEKAFATGNVATVAQLLENSPGLFMRSMNRLLLDSRIKDIPSVVASLKRVVGKASTPVLLSLRQYLQNRNEPKTYRLFINHKGTGRAVKDEQPVLAEHILKPILDVLDVELADRLPSESTFVINEDVLGAALPISNRQTADGFGTMPRGSTEKFEGDILRFFMYWKQKRTTTDFDLSAILYNENFNQVSQVSFTNLRGSGATHSGDLTSAPKGASEFIDIESSVDAKYIVPQVNLYSGEGFNEVEESFFGFMSRSETQKGKPFEPTTVVTKSELRGDKRVALPLVFIKEGDHWTVKWLNMHIEGSLWGNRTETNSVTSAKIAQSVVESSYLTVDYLVHLLKLKGIKVVYESSLDSIQDTNELGENTYYVGRTAPEGLDETVKVITLKNLHELIF